MRQPERLARILEQVSNGGTLAVAELSALFGVSGATIRRDLELLASQQLVSRTHGGAVARGVTYELPLRYKGGRRHDEKRRIAAEAARRVADGIVVGLTGGTTTTEVARALIERPRLTVVTNALNIAADLAIRPNLKLVVTGGVARSESYELVGPLALSTLEGLNLDVAFVGVDGIRPDTGFTTHHEIEAHTNRVLMKRAREVVVVADSSKIGRAAFARICEISEAAELITDEAADAAAVAALAEEGIRVTLV